MKKVYLVKVYMQIGNYCKSFDLEVFTNRKLAKTYLEYRKLKRKQNPLKDVDRVSYELTELIISNLDWSEELLKLQMRESPK